MRNELRATEIAPLAEWKVLGGRIGVTWKGRNFTPETPFLSSVVVAAHEQKPGASLSELLLLARDISSQRQAEAERVAREARDLRLSLQWGGGSTWSVVLDSQEVSWEFLKSELDRRGIAIRTDWDLYHPHSADVPQDVRREIAELVRAQIAARTAVVTAIAALLVVETREIAGLATVGQRVGHFVVTRIVGNRRATRRDDEMDRSNGLEFMSTVELADSASA